MHEAKFMRPSHLRRIVESLAIPIVRVRIEHVHLRSATTRRFRNLEAKWRRKLSKWRIKVAIAEEETEHVRHALFQLDRKSMKKYPRRVRYMRAFKRISRRTVWQHLRIKSTYNRIRIVLKRRAEI